MDKKKIDKLIAISYKGLDKKKVDGIASLISRPDLKKYINGLKSSESEKDLIISTPIDDKYLNKYIKLYPNRKVILRKDPSLLLGVKVIDNDVIYDFTLKKSLEKVLNYIEQNYD